MTRQPLRPTRSGQARHPSPAPRTGRPQLPSTFQLIRKRVGQRSIGRVEQPTPQTVGLKRRKMTGQCSDTIEYRGLRVADRGRARRLYESPGSHSLAGAQGASTRRWLQDAGCADVLCPLPSCRRTGLMRRSEGRIRQPTVQDAAVGRPYSSR